MSDLNSLLSEGAVLEKRFRRVWGDRGVTREVPVLDGIPVPDCQIGLGAAGIRAARAEERRLEEEEISHNQRRRGRCIFA